MFDIQTMPPSQMRDAHQAHPAGVEPADEPLAPSFVEITTPEGFFRAPTFLGQHLPSAMQAFHVAIEQLLAQTPIACDELCHKLTFASASSTTSLSLFFSLEEGKHHTHTLSRAELASGLYDLPAQVRGMRPQGLIHERGNWGHFGLQLEEALLEELAALTRARRAHLFRFCPSLLMALLAMAQEQAVALRPHEMEGYVLLAPLDEQGERRVMSGLMQQLAAHEKNPDLRTELELGLRLLRCVRFRPGKGTPARPLLCTGECEVGRELRQLARLQYGPWSVLRFDPTLWELSYTRYVQLPLDMFARHRSLYEFNAELVFRTSAALDHATHADVGSEQSVDRIFHEAALYQPWRPDPGRQWAYLQRALLRLGRGEQLDQITLEQESLTEEQLVRGAYELLSREERAHHQALQQKQAESSGPGGAASKKLPRLSPQAKVRIRFASSQLPPVKKAEVTLEQATRTASNLAGVSSQKRGSKKKKHAHRDAGQQSGQAHAP